MAKLAIVISAPPRNPQLIGTIVKVLEIDPCCTFVGFGVWAGCLVRPPRPAWGHDAKLHDVGWVQEWRLRPLRDPGDDAKGEMIRPSPLEVVLT